MNSKTSNNFDLIRLFAATQVAISHITSHLGFENQFLSILSLFPGVPIFFFVSGFLIYGSYVQSRKNAKPNINFFVKRFLRLYPALWLCIALSLLSVWQSGYFHNLQFQLNHFTVWIMSQVTFFQFYNPEFMRDYGVGVLNGSLWTITVELQFYLLAPFLYFLLNKHKIQVVGVFLIILICVNILNSYHSERTNFYQKLFNVSFLPWFYMFVFGAATYKYNHFFNTLKKINLIALLFLYGVCYLFTKDWGWGNNINPIAYTVLVLLIIKSAYSFPNLSNNILKGNDISYGIYIFHMPIVNYLLYQNIHGGNGVLLALFFTFFLSIASWFILEKRVLATKKNALRKFTKKS